MIVGYTLVTFLILGLLQTSFVYNAKMHLDQATFEAARAGAVNNGLKAPMQRAFERNLIGLYGGGNDSASINHSWALARADIAKPASANGAGFNIDIQNPTQEAFDDFGFDLPDGRRAIPSAYLRLQSTDIGPTSQVNIQDANLLKIKITYGYQLIVPVVDKLFGSMMSTLDPVHADYYQANPVRIPLTAQALTRMHSDALFNGNLSIHQLNKGGFGAIPKPGEDTIPEPEESERNSDPNNGLKSYKEVTPQGENSPTEEQDLLAVECEENTAEEDADFEQNAAWFEKVGNTAFFRFARGIKDGLLLQAKELAELTTNPMGAIADLISLLDAFIEDPEATFEAMVKALGKELISQVEAFEKCGAYDRGYIIGQYLNPVTISKIPAILNKLSKKVRIGKGHSGKDRNNDRNTNNRDFDGTLITDKNNNGRFDPDEIKDAGIPDINNDGKLNDKDLAIACSILKPNASFPAGTLVHTDQGLKPIEQIQVGDRVLSQDPLTGEIAYKTVTDIYQRRSNDIWVLYYEHPNYEPIQATSEHPFYVQGQGWVNAKELQVGLQVVTKEGSAVIKRLIPNHTFQQVYNFTVADWHNYFVGVNGYWVHNSRQFRCGDGGAAPFANVTKGAGKKIPNCELCGPPGKRGNAPIGKDGHPVELHHRNQNPNGPLDEMTRTDHRLGPNFKKNHPNTGQSPSQIDRKAWRNEQKDYWKKEWDSGRFDDL